MPTVDDRLEAAILGRIGQMPTPFVFGLCGSQGSGKSTAALALQARLESRGLRTVILSLDDLYLSRADRRRLARNVHPLLATRGPPGTHDVAMGLHVLAGLKAGLRVHIPRFDKATDDRCAPLDCPVVDGADVIIFEGWFVGARAQAAVDLIQPVNALERDEDSDGRWRAWTNERLAMDYQALFDPIDCLALLAAPGFHVVGRWRAEQEASLIARLRASGEVGEHVMTPAQIIRFISHFERVTRHLLEEMPARADVLVRLDAERRPLD